MVEVVSKNQAAAFNLCIQNSVLFVYSFPRFLLKYLTYNFPMRDYFT